MKPKMLSEQSAELVAQLEGLLQWPYGYDIDSHELRKIIKLISAQAAQIEALQGLVREMVKEVRHQADEHGEACFFCAEKAGPRGGPHNHAPDCPITRAEALGIKD